MVAYPQFSERIFEFAFNAELSKRCGAILAACPSIPTQQEEKHLGYDVEFQLKRRGGATSSLFLQHKVARFVTGKSGSNAHFHDAIGGPYFAFTLDVPQYNLVHGLRVRRKRKIYYCAPLSTKRREIDEYFLNGQVCSNAVWIDVKSAAKISDNASHSIIYSVDGKKAIRFSEEARSIDILAANRPELGAETHERGLDEEEVFQLYDDVYAELEESWARGDSRARDEPELERSIGLKKSIAVTDRLPKRRSRQVGRAMLIEELSHILASWYGVSWYILVRHEPRD
jgi:hypothetical protein